MDALAGITEIIRQVSTDTFTRVLLDLRKAFDSDVHQIFLSKLVEKDLGRVFHMDLNHF